MQKCFKQLQSKKILLKKFRSTDITKQYISWLNDPEVVKYSNQKFKKHTFATSQKFLLSFKQTKNLFLKINTKKDNAMIGTMTAYFSNAHKTVNLGILIGCRNAWGKGFGYDAWKLLCKWLLRTNKIRKISGGTLRKNIAMIRIMEKTGMKIDGIRKNHELLNKKPIDIIHYCLFNKKK